MLCSNRKQTIFFFFFACLDYKDSQWKDANRGTLRVLVLVMFLYCNVDWREIVLYFMNVERGQRKKERERTGAWDVERLN